MVLDYCAVETGTDLSQCNNIDYLHYIASEIYLLFYLSFDVFNQGNDIKFLNFENIRLSNCPD